MNREGNLDLTSLRIFIETAKDCNMTRAAAALGISQPAVSAAIKKIENSLGSPVFDRDRRPIQLTTAGRLLWNRSFLILEQLDDLTRSIQFSLENEKPDLRLGASDCMSACVCPSLIDYLLNETENISACTGSTPKVTDLLKHRAVDIGLSSDSIEDVPHFQALHFLTERFLFVLPRSLTKRGTFLVIKTLLLRLKVFLTSVLEKRRLTSCSQKEFIVLCTLLISAESK